MTTAETRNLIRASLRRAELLLEDLDRIREKILAEGGFPEFTPEYGEIDAACIHLSDCCASLETIRNEY